MRAAVNLTPTMVAMQRLFKGIAGLFENNYGTCQLVKKMLVNFQRNLPAVKMSFQLKAPTVVNIDSFSFFSITYGIQEPSSQNRSEEGNSAEEDGSPQSRQKYLHEQVERAQR
jgi:hypothetical protein